MRIAFLIGNLAPYRVPVLRKIADLNGFDVTVLLMSAGEWYRAWNVSSHGFRSKVLPGFTIPMYTAVAGPTTLFVNPTLPLELIKGDYDVLVTLSWTQPCSLLALMVSKLKGTPILLWEESIPHRPSLKKRLAMPLIVKVLRSHTGYLAASSRCVEYLSSFGIERARIFLFPQVIDNDRFMVKLDEGQKCSLRSKLGLSQSGPVILYVGQFIPRKGILELLEAWKMLNSIQRLQGAYLVLVGDGELKQHISQFVRRHGLELSVVVIGFRQQDELPLWYAASDIFVLPSRYDTFGVVVNEAMAAGLPVIATEQVGAVGDLVKDGMNGLVVPPCNPPALAEALAQLMKDADKRYEMGDMSRQLIGEWNVDLAASAFMGAISFATHNWQKPSVRTTKHS